MGSRLHILLVASLAVCQSIGTGDHAFHHGIHDHCGSALTHANCADEPVKLCAGCVDSDSHSHDCGCCVSCPLADGQPFVRPYIERINPDAPAGPAGATTDALGLSLAVRDGRILPGVPPPKLHAVVLPLLN